MESLPQERTRFCAIPNLASYKFGLEAATKGRFKQESNRTDPAFKIRFQRKLNDYGPERAMRRLKPQALYITAIIVVMTLAIWVASLLFAYVADDWSSPAADERSIPPSRSY